MGLFGSFKKKLENARNASGQAQAAPGQSSTAHPQAAPRPQQAAHPQVAPRPQQAAHPQVAPRPQQAGQPGAVPWTGTARVEPTIDKDNEARLISIKANIHAFKQDPKQTDRLSEIMRLFMASTFWVPASATVSEADAQQAVKLKPGDTFATKQAIRLKPDLLKTADGKLFFPAFTAREETDEAYRSRFSWIQMPGRQLVEINRSGGNVEGIVINGFSESLVLVRKLLDIMAGAEKVAAHEISKGDAVFLEDVGEAQRPLKLAAVEFLKRRPEVRKAFMGLLHHGGEESYLFAIDTTVDNCKLLFAALNTAVQAAKPDRPVDYAPYKDVKAQVASASLPVFYHRDGIDSPKQRVPLEDTRLFWITEYADGDGAITGYSFDFEKAADSHYSITADEAARLSARLFRDPNRLPPSFIVLVHDALAPLLGQPERLEGALVNLLNANGVRYQSFHYD